MMNVSAFGTSDLWKVMSVVWGALSTLWAFIGYVGAMLGLCWGNREQRDRRERDDRGERGKNEHECWEKTVTEGMAMQAGHE